MLLFLSTHAICQNAYDVFEEAETLFEKEQKEEAFDLLSNAVSNIEKYQEKMSFQEAEKFFDLYASLTYGLGKMSIIDSVYLAGIDYGKLIENDTLSCKYINLRGNLWRIKNQWAKAIDIFKTGLD